MNSTQAFFLMWIGPWVALILAIPVIMLVVYLAIRFWPVMILGLCVGGYYFWHWLGTLG